MEKNNKNLFEVVMLLFHNRDQMTFRQIHSELKKADIVLTEDQLNVIVRRITNKDHYLSWQENKTDSWESTFTLEKIGEDRIYEIFKNKVLIGEYRKQPWDFLVVKLAVITFFITTALSVYDRFCPPITQLDPIVQERIDILSNDVEKLRVEISNYLLSVDTIH